MSEHTVAQCAKMIAECDVEGLSTLLDLLADDERAGVQAAVQRGRRRLERFLAESDRLDRLSVHEARIRDRGFVAVAGADEVGRGALAGPLTIGVVVLDPGVRIEGIDDSKRLSPQRREALDPIIRTKAPAHAVVHVEATEIDSLGLTAATRRAIALGLGMLDPAADHVIVDGLGVGGLPVPETAIVGGDSSCAAVAAASVLAKVERDRIMVELDATYPGYDFALNKGYGTTEHIAAIGRLGPSAVHRKSFSPCNSTLSLF